VDGGPDGDALWIIVTCDYDICTFLIRGFLVRVRIRVRDFTFLVVFVALGGRRRMPDRSGRDTRRVTTRRGRVSAVPVDFKNEIYR
jgi:hypothetical protein